MGTTPWHLWGNLQRQSTPVETVGQFRFGNQQQLCKVGYGRPDTWHWFFSARLISGPDNTAGFFTRVFVHFDVTLGSGRAATPIAFEFTPFAKPSFEDYTFQWGPVNPAFPANAMIWSTQSLSPNRSFQGDGPNVADVPLTQIPAESIQVQCRIVALTAVGNVAAVGQPVEVEVSSYWAPKSHVRPDWFQVDALPHTQFPGNEVPGR